MNEVLLAEAISELQTINDTVRWAASCFEEAGLFYGHGTDNAWDEAAFIVLSTLYLPPDSPLAVYQSRLTTTEKQRVIQQIQRRVVERVPAAYLTREAWFAGMAFYVDERVLVPRSPLAELIQQRFAPWLDGVQVARIADVCTGSGCIACALAEFFPEAQVDALDISAEALTVAAINVAQHGLQQQIELIQSDLLSEVLPRQYDLIVTNPPYVSKAVVDELPAEYQAEPRLGLDGGVAGLDCIAPLLRQAKACLRADGILICEVGHSQAALQAQYPEMPFLWLDFAAGGEGVFLLTAQQLFEYPGI